MGKKLYVGSLPYEVTNDQLKELFSKAGVVDSVNVFTDSFSGRSKGFGFIEMSTDEEAVKAIEMFNGYALGGRSIVVNEARPKPEYKSGDSHRSYPGRSFGGGYGDRGRDSNRGDSRGRRGGDRRGGGRRG